MPSRHEGFGLIGWEAIGTGTPLILGSDTGLAEQLKALDVTSEGLAQVLTLRGALADKEALANAIIEVARDIPRALRKARALREALISEFGCTWDQAANALLEALGKQPVPASPSALQSPFTGARSSTVDHYPECAELELSVGQGTTANSIELIAELRFGSTETGVEGIEAEIALTRARLKVVPDPGKLEGVRLGDPERPAKGIRAQAGGVWILTADGQPLSGKVLGDEAICRIEAPEGIGAARVELTAAKRDFTCTIRSGGRRLKANTEKVLGVFLKNALLKDESAHVLLNSGHIGGNDAN